MCFLLWTELFPAVPQCLSPAPCVLEGYRHHSLGEEMHLPGLCGWSYKKEAIVPDRLCYSLKLHPWVTKNGAELLPTEDENCTLVEVTEEEVENSVKHIPSLATVVSVSRARACGHAALAAVDEQMHKSKAETSLLSGMGPGLWRHRVMVSPRSTHQWVAGLCCIAIAVFAQGEILVQGGGSGQER